MVIPEVKINNKTYYILLIALGLILIIPVIDTKIIPGHDHIFHITRIEAFAEALKQGVFPVRMCIDQVQFWGAPTGIFYPGFFSYLPALLKILGLPIEICFNLFIATIIYSGLFASWNGFSLLTRSKLIGLLSTVLYISSGYYLFSAHMRNALGELIALSFMPLAIASIIYIINKTKVTVSVYLFSILSISAIIESHVLNTVFLVLFSICYLIVKHNKITLSKLKKLSFLTLILFLLNASFIVPFLQYYKEVPLNVHFTNDFSKNGFRFTTILCFLIYWNSWLVIAHYAFLSRCLYNSKHYCHYKHKQFIYYAWYILLGALFVFASSSAFPWDYVPQLREVLKVMQFPWRFLGPASLFLSISGGFGLYLLLKKAKLNQNKIIMLSFLVCLFHFFAFTYLTPLKYFGNWDMYEKCYWIRKPFFSDEDYLYRDMDVAALYRLGDSYISDAKITDWRKNLTDISFSYKIESHDTTITLPLINYPGYTAINHTGKSIPITEDDNHMMVIPLPKGNGEISIQFNPKPFQAADAVTLITTIILIYQMGLLNTRKKWNKLM